MKNLAIWGNHSPTMFPDFENTLVNGKPALQAIPDRGWFEGDFLKTVQQRGKAIIDARGKSSAASAANAVVNHLQSLNNPTPAGEWFSGALLSDGNTYGVPEGLIYSFPLRVEPDGALHVVEGVSLSEYAKGKLAASANELLEERDAIKELLK